MPTTVRTIARYPTAGGNTVDIVLTETPAEPTTVTIGFLSETRECLHLILTATCSGCGNQHTADNDGRTFAEDRDHELRAHSRFAQGPRRWAQLHAEQCPATPNPTA